MFKFRLCVLLAALAFAHPAAAQDCTLSSTAVCDGVPCPGATRPEGHIFYNDDYSVAQICQDGIWVALGPLGDFCPGAGLVGYWKFNESGNVSTADDSAGTNDGTLTNFPADPSANWVAGKLGNALDFDGTDDYVSTPVNPSTDLGDFSIALWVYSRSGTGGLEGKAIYMADSGGANRFYLRHQNTSNPSTDLILGLGSWADTHINSITLNAWHHYVVVLDGTTGYFYKDGTLFDTQSSVTVDHPNMTINIGTREGANNDFFDGLLDDVRIGLGHMKQDIFGNL